MAKKTLEGKNESTVKAVTEKKNKTKQILVYLGPTIKGVTVQYSQFTNGIPKRLKAYAEEHVDVKRLIVPVENFLEVKKNISIQGSVEYNSYNNILNQKGE